MCAALNTNNPTLINSTYVLASPQRQPNCHEHFLNPDDTPKMCHQASLVGKRRIDDNAHLREQGYKFGWYSHIPFIVTDGTIAAPPNRAVLTAYLPT